jgi:hypothetical protein
LGVTPERIIEILDAKADRDDIPVKDRLLHSIIDGPMDADKLDYLKRDSDRLGVPYSRGIDVDRIIRSLTVVLDRKGKGLVACIGVHEKAKVAAEFVAIARYAMFSQAYWHHTVRSMKAMLTRSVVALLTHLDAKGERLRNEFRSDFENLVLSLPGSLYQGQPLQPMLFEAEDEKKEDVASSPITFDVSGVESTLAATDAVVIAFIKFWLGRAKMKEAELLDDLLNRHLYKRLFVFSMERSEKECRVLVDQWERLSAKKKGLVYEKIEKTLVPSVESRLEEGPPTATLNINRVELLRKRIEANQPVILIDVPGARPGSDVPLYYVVEAQRRALRKDEHAVGDVQASEVWNQFGSGLRDRAGKVRIFCHPRFVDAVEAAVDRVEFFRLFEKSAREVA